MFWVIIIVIIIIGKCRRVDSSQQLYPGQRSAGVQSAGEYENSLEKKGVAGDGVLILLPPQVHSSDTL